MQPIFISAGERLEIFSIILWGKKFLDYS